MLEGNIAMVRSDASVSHKIIGDFWNVDSWRKVISCVSVKTTPSWLLRHGPT